MNWRTVGIWILLSGVAVGCNNDNWRFGMKAPSADVLQPVPEPINLLLPNAIRIHPFTGTQIFDADRNLRGVDVRIEVMDAYGDAAKAFGDFRFEMYQFIPNSIDPKGKRIATWEESLIEPKKNLLHWDKITRTYEFKLQWDEPIAPGRQFVLLAYFDSPFTDRLQTERVFTGGK